MTYQSATMHLNHYSAPPSLSDLEGLAREALNAIPLALRRMVGEVVIKVEEFPDDETM